jgi:S1-C subfamily serine protease
MAHALCSRFSIAGIAVLVLIGVLTGGITLTPPAHAQTDKKPEPPALPHESITTILRAVVGIHSKIPPGATTAKFLGLERTGSGVVIDSTGLVLTIGYLILEASDIEIIRPGGKKVPARFVGYDNASGLGLVRATGPLNLKPVKLGGGDSLEAGNPVMIVSHAGMPPVSAAQVVSRRPFAGYWEYILEKAIFTSPPHTEYSGAVLFGEDGHVHGIGTTFVNDAIAPHTQLPGNVFVPVDTLKSVMVDLLEEGRPGGPVRPWIGIHTSDTGGRIHVLRVVADGPAAQAGIKPGDVIVGIDGTAIKSSEALYRKIWSLGTAGAQIPLDVVTEKKTDINVRRVDVRSQNPYDGLKLDRR